MNRIGFGATAIALFIVIGSVFHITSTADDRQPTTQVLDRFDGKFVVYTLSESREKTFVVDPAFVSIGGTRFLKGTLLESPSDTKYIAVKHVVEIAPFREQKDDTNPQQP